MTKKEIIDMVYLRVSGGQLSPDIPLEYAEIEAMLPVATNEAITLYHREQRRESLEDIRIYGQSDSSSSLINQEFLVTHQVSIEKDEVRDRYYFNMPGKLASLPKGRGLDEVFPAQGPHDYIKVASEAAIVGLPSEVDPTFYWFERLSGGVSRVYFSQMGLPICGHYARLVLDFSSLGDNDEVPLPSGMELMIIERLVSFFKGQKEEKEEVVIDDKQDMR